RLASASTDRTVREWDVASGRELRILEGHAGEVRGVAFSPRGDLLASAGGDGTARLWDAVRGQRLLTLSDHSGPVTGVAFSPDGRLLASASSDGTVKVSDATPLTAELRDEREALGLVQFFFARPGSKAKVLERLQADPTLAEPVRRRVAALVEPHSE